MLSNYTVAMPAWKVGQDVVGNFLEFKIRNRLFRTLISVPQHLAAQCVSEMLNDGGQITKFEAGEFPLRDEPEDTWLLIYTHVKWNLIIRGDFVVFPEGELALIRGRDIDAAGFHDFRGTMLVLPSHNLTLYDRTLLMRQAGKNRLKMGWGRILAAYMESLDVQILGQAVRDESAWLMLEQHIMALLRRALLGAADTIGVHGMENDAQDALRSKGEVLFQRLCAWISENFANPEMSSDFVASQFDISPRYIQNLFSKYGNGETFVSFLRDKRMRRAWEMLSSIDCIHQSVSEICWNCGFSDPVYFGKIFRRFYGMTPGMARKNSLKEAVGSL
ncbi:helix-turn-helix transcriptional regulator [Kerstersia similis]|uniref:helix-turn-helix transcriptional regulator n=1 Tax=Kerstersia similis TaxID=206505 RepID=UPI0039F037C8